MERKVPMTVQSSRRPLPVKPGGRIDLFVFLLSLKVLGMFSPVRAERENKMARLVSREGAAP